MTFKFSHFNEKMNSLERIQQFFNQRFVKFGLPFLFVIVGGSFGLKEFAQLRYQFSRKSQISPDELEKHGIKMKKPGEVTLETEYDKIKNLDTDNWEQIRGPRPWEEDFQEKK